MRSTINIFVRIHPLSISLHLFLRAASSSVGARVMYYPPCEGPLILYATCCTEYVFTKEARSRPKKADIDSKLES